MSGYRAHAAGTGLAAGPGGRPAEHCRLDVGDAIRYLVTSRGKAGKKINGRKRQI